jgi:hypothetical protein
MLPFLNPRSPNSMLSLYHGILPKVVSALFTTLNWGGGGGGGEGETKFVLSMFNNFVILAGMVSRVLSKIVVWTPNVIGWFVVTWLEINAMYPAGQQVKNCCPPRPATYINKQNGGTTTILDKTLETIPANITKLLNIDKTNFVSPSPPVQCCEQRRNNFW